MGNASGVCPSCRQTGGSKKRCTKCGTVTCGRCDNTSTCKVCNGSHTKVDV